MKNVASSLLVAVALWSGEAAASVVPIGIGVFPSTSLLVTFTGLADGTEVNGLAVGGLTFGYSLGNGQVVIDGGPGTTTHISQPNIVSTGNNTGVLTVLLPFATTEFGYGFAILTNIGDPVATTLSIFNGATLLGTQSYSGTPDPTFTGGFAGILSTVAFDRVAITFDALNAGAFALDNIRVSATADVPEPPPLLLMVAGLAVLGWGARRKARRAIGRLPTAA